MTLRLSLAVVLLLCLVVVPAVAARDPQPTPLMRTVDPASAKAGDTVTVTGENLTKDVVVEVYLTDRKNKTKVTVVEQTNTSVKFVIPSGTKPGKYWLMVLANLSEPLLIEEPAFVTVE